MTKSFAERVVLITGGAAGIGKGIAHEFAVEGASVALNDVNEKALRLTCREISKLGVRCEPFPADISKNDQVTKMVRKVISSMAKIDVLVSNAGIVTTTDFLQLDEPEWDRVLSVNLKGAYFVTQAVLRHMIKRRYGRIIMISSLTAETGGVVTGVPYDVSKAGLIVMAKALARKYSNMGITVNAVAPGSVDTNMLQDMGVENPNDLVKLNVIQRLGTPQDVANAVLFLASEKSSFITGETINVNGGRLMD
jgi:3-oxoacyl-[acyl-carrier protein] reductase